MCVRACGCVRDEFLVYFNTTSSSSAFPNYVCKHTYLYCVCMCVIVYVCVCICVCVHVCMCVRVYVCTCMYS